MKEDVFRQEYTPVSDEKKAVVLELKKKAQGLYDLFDNHTGKPEVDQRMLSLAKTNLEQSVMWAVKGIFK